MGTKRYSGGKIGDSFGTFLSVFDATTSSATSDNVQSQSVPSRQAVDIPSGVDPNALAVLNIVKTGRIAISEARSASGLSEVEFDAAVRLLIVLGLVMPVREDGQDWLQPTLA